MRVIFKILIGFSALFIASCSAFFSVRGLGLLFIGSATAVMIMAASLEVGKLITASLLYQYWSKITIPIRIYLMAAVGVLICITSLGIYGFLASAYDRTNAEVKRLQENIEGVERQMADTQARIDNSRNQLGKLSDVQRQDIDSLQQQIPQANQSLDQELARLDGRRKEALQKRDDNIDKLHQQITDSDKSMEQSLARLDDRRKTIRGKRDQDAAQLNTRIAEADKLLASGLATADRAVADLNDRVAVMDRAVDAYTEEGGGGFLKDDSIRKGQALREQQQDERDQIARDIAHQRDIQEQLRKAHAATVKSVEADISAAGDESVKELAGVDDDEKGLRKIHADTVKTIDAQITSAGDQFTRDEAALDDEEKTIRKSGEENLSAVRQQIASMQNKDQSLATDNGSQIESLYAKKRMDNEEIQKLQEQIDSTDVGTYRFVARAFNAQVDEVVKWLILVIVAVFDPLAVALTIGFNVAVNTDRQRGGWGMTSGTAGAPAMAGGPGPGGVSTVPGGPAGAGGVGGHDAGPAGAAKGGATGGAQPWQSATGAGAIIVLAVGLLGGVGYYIVHAVHVSQSTSHSRLIPADSFAVVAFRPPVLRQSGTDASGASPAGGMISQPVAATLADLLSNGFDPDADVYAFVKYPSDTGDKPSDRPEMLCGLVARVTDPVAAEASLSRCAETLARALRPPTPGSASLTRSRVMIDCGQGRYLDPEGGFFTFGMTRDAAVLLLDIDGDPDHPRVEQEMRQCLSQTEDKQDDSPNQAPVRHYALPAGGAVALWFDAARCFADMPKSAAAQMRYQQLEPYLDFDLSLVAQPSGSGALKFIGTYNYVAERFSTDATTPPVLDLLAKLGPADTAGIPGRLMDRCADTLDFDSLIDHLRLALSSPQTGNARAQVVVEKNSSSSRDAGFVLTARYDPQAGPPLVAAFRSLSLF